MKKCNALAAAWFVACMCANQALAEQRAFVCEPDDSNDAGFIATPVVFVLDEANKTVSVSDPIILNTYQAPVAGRLTQRGADTYRIRWRVQGIRTVQAQVTASYTAELEIAPSGQGSVKINGRLVGFSNRLRGTGACRPLTQDEINRALRS